MTVIDAACFIFDMAFALYYLDARQNRRNLSKFRNALSFIVLLMSILLYYGVYENTIGIFAYSLPRFLYRIIILDIYLIVTKQGTLSRNIYIALYLSAIYTLSQNIFLTTLAVPVLRGTEQFTSSQTGNLFLCLLIVIGTKSFFYAIVCRLTPLRYMENDSFLGIILLIIITGAGVFIKETLITASDNTSADTYEMSVYIMILQISFLLLLILLQCYQQQLREKQAIQLQNVSNQSLMENISLVEKNMEEVQFLRHDLKNHMITLRLLIQKQETERAVTYIDDFLGQASLPPLYVQTGNRLLDGLLSEKMNVAYSKEIPFQVKLDFSQSDFISTFDLCTIMGNLVDNAIEATSKVQSEEERFIEVRGGIAAGCLMVYIVNSYYVAPQMRNGNMHTTKANSHQHGLGIRNVRHILEKYDGNLSVSTEKGNVFIASILIPLPEEQSSENRFRQETTKQAK
ncbi:MAG: GHKL domain-containing protein [Clostridiales bacterium]|nr:GHKL domain-containing protein [Clostridiales bacterium]